MAPKSEHMVSGEVTVAIQGVAGSFSHEAALKLFGSAVELLPCTSFDDLFEAVSRGAAGHGVVPIENSLAGSVHRNYDLLAEYELHIVGEVLLRVQLCLIAGATTQMSDVRRVVSHPVALAQCRRFLALHRGIETRAAFDTATGVREVLQGGRADEAAIGSSLAAQLYGGVVLQDGLEDHEENYTRFLSVSRVPAAEHGASKVSLVFTLGNRPGSLHQALGEFARRGIDLTKLESRPLIGRPWEYLFYLDCVVGAANDIDGAIAALSAVATSVRILGKYRSMASPMDY